MKNWYDAHFSLNGFIKVYASDKEDAGIIAKEILEKSKDDVEEKLRTGIGIEVYEILKEE